MQCYHRPAEGFVADVIPFFWQGHYHLFYLCPAPGGAEGIVWRELVTSDFAHMEDWEQVFTNGSKEEQDLALFTGSVLEHDGLFHIFYTGNNGYFAERGEPGQVILHATSHDLRNWTKDPEFRFPPATAEGYELQAWRDAFVFWNEDAAEFWMLLTARLANELPRSRRGCIAVAASTDLKQWSMREPLYAPGLFESHECPDIFKFGDWWYLVFSTFIGPWATRYRMARSLNGPWITPPDDLLDAQAFYAAKTAGDGERRYLCGWVTNREGDKDDGKWLWGGNLLVHELRQRPDGTLAVRPPEAVPAQFTQAVALEPAPRFGAWDITADGFSIQSEATFAALTLGTLPGACLIEAAITPGEGAASCGLFVRATDTLENAYAIRLDPARQQIAFEAWPPPFNASLTMTRPLALAAGQAVHLRVIIDGTLIVIYADDEVALSSRMYHPEGHAWGLFATEGDARFTQIALRTAADSA
jgi:beta-fructofuranosidase